MIQLTLLFLLISSPLLAYQEKVSGIIVDDFDIPLVDATVRTLQGIEAITDCDGKFKIKAAVGDTLLVSKNRYLSAQYKVLMTKKNIYRIDYDYEPLKTAIEENLEDFGPLKGRCGPFYMVDRVLITPEVSKHFSWGHIDIERDVKHLEVFLGKKGERYFGKLGKVGVVMLFTHCDSFIRDPKYRRNSLAQFYRHPSPPVTSFIEFEGAEKRN